MSLTLERGADAVPDHRQQQLEEPRILLCDTEWSAYRAIGEALRDRSNLRLTYSGGTLEIMTTSSRNERYRMLIGRLVETLAEELDLPLEPPGSMTFQRQDLQKGLEPDQCYWIAGAAEMAERLDYDPQRDPPPDLVVEVEVSRSALDKMAIYAALEIPEVWRFDGERITVGGLLEEGEYGWLETSPTFPDVSLAEAARFLRRDEKQTYLQMARELRQWSREQRGASDETG